MNIENPIFHVVDPTPGAATNAGILCQEDSQRYTIFGQPFDLDKLALQPVYRRQITLSKTDLQPGYKIISEEPDSEYLRINDVISDSDVISSTWRDVRNSFFTAGIPIRTKIFKLDCSEEVKGKFIISFRNFPSLAMDYDVQSRRDNHLFWDLEHQRDFSFTMMPICNTFTKVRYHLPEYLNFQSAIIRFKDSAGNDATNGVNFANTLTNPDSLFSYGFEMRVESRFQWPAVYPDTIVMTEWDVLDFQGTHLKGPYEESVGRIPRPIFERLASNSAETQ